MSGRLKRLFLPLSSKRNSPGVAFLDFFSTESSRSRLRQRLCLLLLLQGGRESASALSPQQRAESDKEDLLLDNKPHAAAKAAVQCNNQLSGGEARSRACGPLWRLKPEAVRLRPLTTQDKI